jgi:hypothetical protein
MIGSCIVFALGTLVVSDGIWKTCRVAFVFGRPGIAALMGLAVIGQAAIIAWVILGMLK